MRASPSVDDHLQAAATALQRTPPDLRGAFDGLLSAWRQQREPSIAAVIVELSSRSQPFVDLAALSGLKVKELALAWIDRLRQGDPVVLGALLAQLQTTAAETTWGRVFACFDALGDVPPDPRVAAFAALMLLTPPYDVNTRNAKFWTCLGRLLKEHGDNGRLLQLKDAAPWAAGDDRRHPLARIRKIIDVDHGGSVDPQSTKLIAQLQRRVEQLEQPALRPAVQSALVRAEEAAGSESEASLLEQIYAQPDESGLRMVYADWLLEQGDSEGRGELINLQAAEEPTAAMNKRAARLLRKHGKSWLGPLARLLVLKSVQWEGGFPAEAAVRALNPVQASSERERVEWATFKALSFSHASTKGKTFAAPQMCAIRRLDNLCEVGLEQVCQHLAGSRLESLSIAGWIEKETLQEHPGWRALITCDGLTSLTELGLGYGGSPHYLEAFFDTRLAHQLKLLHMEWHDYPGLKQWRPYFERLSALEVLRIADDMQAITLSGMQQEPTIVFWGKFAHERNVRHLLEAVDATAGWCNRVEVRLDRWRAYRGPEPEVIEQLKQGLERAGVQATLELPDG